jgi:hypothetical protein
MAARQTEYLIGLVARMRLSRAPGLQDERDTHFKPQVLTLELSIATGTAENHSGRKDNEA